MRIIGLISGSSLDGLDVALCHFSGKSPSAVKWSLVRTETFEFSEGLLLKLKQVSSCSVIPLKKLEVEFTEFCISAIEQFLEKVEVDVDYIASHGHTVFHYPEDGFTLQIGSGALLAEGTGIPCISDLRSNDIALGGQGAPVAPIVEQWLYRGYDYYINLGGIANISVHSDSEIISFDSCPCNQVLNFVAQRKGMPYDKGGLLAQSGQPNSDLIRKMKTHSYFGLPAPKSLDNSWVHEEFITKYIDSDLSPEDLLASMSHFIADQLSDDLTRNIHKAHAPSQILLTGGGAHNHFLVDVLRSKLKGNIKLVIPEKQTIDFKEAVLIALMGYLRVHKIPNIIPSVTGAKRPSTSGAMYWPLPDPKG